MSQPSMESVRARYQNNPDAQAYREQRQAERQQRSNGQAPPSQSRRGPAQQQQTHPRTMPVPRDLSREMAHEEAQERAGLTRAQQEAVANALVHPSERRGRRTPVQQPVLSDEEKYADSTPQERRAAWERGEAPYGYRADGNRANPPGRPKLDMIQELEEDDPADLDTEGIEYEENPEDEWDDGAVDPLTGGLYAQPEPVRPPVRPSRQERPVQQQRTTRRNPPPQPPRRPRLNPGISGTLTMSGPPELVAAWWDLLVNVGIYPEVDGEEIIGVRPTHIPKASVSRDDEWEIQFGEDRRGKPGDVGIRYVEVTYDNL
jgi:hypothetical protein